jgi:hypothetical protein
MMDFRNGARKPRIPYAETKGDRQGDRVQSHCVTHPLLAAFQEFYDALIREHAFDVRSERVATAGSTRSWLWCAAQRQPFAAAACPDRQAAKQLLHLKLMKGSIAVRVR